MTLINVQDLTIEYATDTDPVRAIDGVDFTISERETLGIVGESGCGKTTLIKSLIGMLDENGDIVDGTVEFAGDDISQYSEQEYRKKIRWDRISFIPQNAMSALDPVYRVGDQIIEAIRAHTDVSKRDAREQARSLAKDVGLDPGSIDDYPHELSGGQRQRVTIALAIALEPALIIADEPTTGLDVLIQDEVLSLLNEIQEDLGCGMAFVSHDMSAIAEISDTVAVMYGGRIAEIGDIESVFQRPAHPYTMGLKNAFPSLGNQDELIEIGGSPPDLKHSHPGCRFTDRCPFATEECEQKEPEHQMLSETHYAKCHYTSQANDFRERSKRRKTWE